MTKTPAYHAGYLLGKRDRDPRPVSHEKRDFQHGYSDGIAAARGWAMSW